jgi:tyrosinase
MAKFTRLNVWDAGGDNGWGGPVLWYARGVKAMKAKNVDLLNVRTGWRFFAAMHGFSAHYWQQRHYFTPGEKMPTGKDEASFWNQCQHGSWYFLPWHRGYLMAVEAVLRDAIVKAGGPHDWALPYWNYFKPKQNALPPAFATPDWPDGKGDNPLHVVQRYGPDDPNGHGGGKVFVEIGGQNGTNVDALGDPQFVSPDDNSTAEFGGIKTGFLSAGGDHGGIESAPHDDVHVFVGGGWNVRPAAGLMTWPPTAGLDPIFYLHHANIDRLWEAWKASPASQGDPTDRDWLKGPTNADPTARAFVMPKPDGSAWTYTPEEVHDLAALDYTYDDLAAAAIVPPLQARLRTLGIAPATAAAAVATTQGAHAMAAPPKNAELLGATAGLRVSGAEANTTLTLDNDVRNRLTASLTAARQTAKPDRVFLRLEKIKSDHDGIPFVVYLGLPGGEEHRAGLITLFGVSQASQPGGEHAGEGMTRVIEVSNIIDRLHAADALKAGTLRVRVVPRHPVPDSANLSIGRISLYRQSG